MSVLGWDVNRMPNSMRYSPGDLSDIIPSFRGRRQGKIEEGKSRKGKPAMSMAEMIYRRGTSTEDRSMSATMSAPMSAKPAIVPPAAVAVVGLGNMGVPMGACLIKAGFAVTGFDPAEAARKSFDAAGGRTATDVAAVAAADVVVTLLPNGKIVRDAVHGMRAHLKPGAIVVDMS